MNGTSFTVINPNDPNCEEESKDFNQDGSTLLII